MPENQRKQVWNVKCTKIASEDRDAYRAHADGYIEQHGGDDGESVEVGGVARYAVSLDEAGAAAFWEASNLLEMEVAPEDTADPTGVPTDEAAGIIHDGVDRDMLTMHHMLDLDSGSLMPLLMVTDTGATGNAYVKSRMLDGGVWTWFNDDGLGRNSHGPWCLGAATPPEAGKFVVSAKVLGDNGSGSSANTVAAYYRFARLCRDRGVPGVISSSLGSRSPSEAYRDAIAYCLSQNVVVIASAGNDGRTDGIGYPGGYATSVGACGRSWKKASFSNRNADHSLPDCYALGVSVNGIGGVKSGTSMATPGVARAVWYAMSRGMKAGTVKAALRSHNGSGRVLDARRLLPPISPLVPKAPEPEKPSPEPRPGLRYVVQAGSFAGRKGAERRLAEVKAGRPVEDAFIAIVEED